MARITRCVSPDPCKHSPAFIHKLRTAFAFGLLYESGRPNGNYFAGIATRFVTAYTASTFAFNVIVTALIVGRIVAVGRRLGYATSGKGGGGEFRLYTGAAAIVVESALPFTVFSAAYLVTYGIGSDIAVAFSFYAMFTVRPLPALSSDKRMSAHTSPYALLVHLPATDHAPRPVAPRVDARLLHALHYHDQLPRRDRLRHHDWRVPIGGHP